MSTSLNFKNRIDLPEWRPLATAPVLNDAGRSLACDFRKDEMRDPYIWGMASSSTGMRYNTLTDAWDQLTFSFTTIGGSFGAASFCLFVPSAGLTGTVAGSPTTTSFTLATLPSSATVNINQLANRGDGRGYFVRVIGKTAGKVEIREISANGTGTAPVIYLKTPLTFTPVAGSDVYEILSGALFLAGSGSSAGAIKKYHFPIRTSENISVTNLLSLGTATAVVALDEQHVPYNRQNQTGYFDNGASYDSARFACIQANASSGTTIAADLSSTTIQADEYKKFCQVRIVEDTVTPTSVGQRRVITSHTAAAVNTTFTVPTWSVTPSTSAKFVVENNNDILLWTNTQSVTNSYAAGFAADASWSTASSAGGAQQYANPPTGIGAVGCFAAHCFSIQPDDARIARHSYIACYRGGGSQAYPLFNAAANTWTNTQGVEITVQGFNTGSTQIHDPVGNQGRYMYMNRNNGTDMYRYDIQTLRFTPFAPLPITQGLTNQSYRMAFSVYEDNGVYVPQIYIQGCSLGEFFSTIPVFD